VRVQAYSALAGVWAKKPSRQEVGKMWPLAAPLVSALAQHPDDRELQLRGRQALNALAASGRAAKTEIAAHDASGGLCGRVDVWTDLARGRGRGQSLPRACC
jgi:hypothetical protein